MSLQVGLPLNKDLRQKGLSDVTITNNGAAYDNSVGCPMGGCYSFDGSNDYLTGTYEGTDNITFAAWIYFPTLPGGKHVFDGRISSNGDVGYQPMYITNTQIQIGCSKSSYVYFNYTGAANTGYHVCVTHSPSEGKVYINGALIGTSTAAKGVNCGALTFTLGSRFNQANYCNVKLNDVRIYNECLSANDVATLATGLAVHYPLTRQGFPSENLFQATAFDKEEIGTLFGNNADGWENRPCGFYNGAASNHNIADGIDTITVNSASNIGIAFCRKASDIALDPNSYYTISCEAQSTQTTKPLCIGLSYNNGNATSPWIGRGGTNPQNFTAVNKWQKFTLTFKPDADTQYIDYCFTVSGESGSSFTYKLRHCKLEKGSTATGGIPNSTDALGKSMGLNSNSIEDISGFDWHGVKSDLLQGTGDTHVYPVCADFTSGQSCAILNPPDYQDNANLTLAAWVYPKARNTDRDCILIYHGQYLTIDSTGHLSGYAYGKSPAGYHTSTGTVPLNQGSHIAITGDASNIKLYINGALDKSVACTGTFSGAVKVIGCIGLEVHPNGENPTSTSRQFIGSIADVRVYATALSAANITKLYNNTIYLNNMHNIA